MVLDELLWIHVRPLPEIVDASPSCALKPRPCVPEPCFLILFLPDCVFVRRRRDRGNVSCAWSIEFLAFDDAKDAGPFEVSAFSFHAAFFDVNDAAFKDEALGVSAGTGAH